jgi:hypothetical protein
MKFREYVNEGMVDSRETIDGYRVDIVYQAPKGYYAVGKSPEIKRVISKKYFDSSEEAIEHATLEIEGYLL